MTTNTTNPSNSNHFNCSRATSRDVVDALVRKAEALGIPVCSEQRALERLIDGNHLDEGEIVQIATTLLSEWQVGHADKAPCGISLPSLLDHLKTNERCVQVIGDAGKAYKIDLASIVLGSESSRAYWADKSRLNAFLLSDSFERLNPVSRCDNGDSVRLWTKYLLHALTLCETVPASLLAWAADSEANARSATCALGQMRGKTQGWPWQDRQVRRRLPQFTEQVMREVLSRHASDTAACYVLAGALEDQGRYHEARATMRKFLLDGDIAVEDECHLRHEILQVYRREFSELKQMDGSFEGIVGRNEAAFSADCEKLVEVAAANGLPKDSYLKTQALFEKDHGDAGRALALTEQMESRYTANLVAGMIHNDWALLHEGSPLYDSELAIDRYVEAWEALHIEKPDADASKRLSVLYPLAGALHDAGYDGDAIDVCQYALSLKREPKVLNLLKRLGEKPSVGVGDDVALPAILVKAVDAGDSGCEAAPNLDVTNTSTVDDAKAFPDFDIEAKPTGLRKMLGILKRAS